MACHIPHPQNLVNTAAIRAAIENHETVGQADFEFAYDKQTMGTEWKSRARPKYCFLPPTSCFLFPTLSYLIFPSSNLLLYTLV